MVLSSHLRERSDREPPGQAVGLVEHGGDVLGRGEQCQAVLGQRGRRPQLAAGCNRMAGPVADTQQPWPVAAAAAVVDHAHEPVEIGAVDQFVEGVVGRRRTRQTSGHG